MIVPLLVGIACSAGVSAARVDATAADLLAPDTVILTSTKTGLLALAATSTDVLSTPSS